MGDMIDAHKALNLKTLQAGKHHVGHTRIDGSITKKCSMGVRTGFTLLQDRPLFSVNATTAIPPQPQEVWRLPQFHEVCDSKTDPFLGRDLEANNGTAAVAVQRRDKRASTTTKLLPSKHVPVTTVTHATEETGCCLRGPRRGVKKKRIEGKQFS
jgi:hypothetical protein